MKPGRWVLLAAILTASCSTAPTTSSTLTPAAFTMTWPGLTFPTTGVGTTSATPIIITLWNTGTSAVPVASVTDSNSDEFPFTTTCQIPGSLAASSSCTVTARFKPSGLGARTGTLTINANNASQGLAFTGNGASINPQLTIASAGVAPSVFTLALTGATPSGAVELHTTYTPAPGNPPNAIPTSTWTADATGALTAAVTDAASGTYDHWMIDLTSGVSTNHILNTVP